MWSAAKGGRELVVELRVELRHNVFVRGHWPLVEENFAVFVNNTLFDTRFVSPSNNVLKVHILSHPPQWRHFLVRRRSLPFLVLPTQLFEESFDFIPCRRARVTFLIHGGHRG